MSFRDFIQEPGFRKAAGAALKQWNSLAPPKKPSRKYIDRCVAGLLDENRSRAALKLLTKMGPKAVPALVAALEDERFHLAEWDCFYTPAPLPAVLELLAPHGPEHVIAVAVPLAKSKDADVRQAIARPLAATGRTDAVPALKRLLRDRDGHVRLNVARGVHDAIEADRAEPEFRTAMYALLLEQCDCDWKESGNEAAQTIIEIDRECAQRDLATERFLNTSNRELHHLLQACNRADLKLPEPMIRAVVDDALAKAVGERCYPFQYMAGEALEALALSAGKKARPILKRALSHDHEQVRRGAAEGLARIEDLKDPIQFAVDRAHKEGIKKLQPAQRTVFLAFLFDMDVSNGGLLQFFGNSSGDHAAEVIEALKAVGHRTAARSLTKAIDLVGPGALKRGQDRRLKAFEGRVDELQAAFRPLEQAFYEAKPTLWERMLLYTTKHADQFREPAQ